MWCSRRRRARLRSSGRRGRGRDEVSPRRARSETSLRARARPRPRGGRGVERGAWSGRQRASSRRSRAGVVNIRSPTSTAREGTRSGLGRALHVLRAPVRGHPQKKTRSASRRTSLGRGHGTDSARDARLAGRARAPERRRRERHRLGSSEGRHGACSRRVRWEVCGGLDAISKRPFTTQQTKRLRSTRKSTGARRSCAAQDFHAGLANAFETSYEFRG